MGCSREPNWLIRKLMKAQGILPSQAIGALIETGAISAGKPIGPGQVQPSSLDLRLGARAFRVRASFMPGPTVTTEEQIERFLLHTIDLGHGAVLETGCVYVAEIEEHLALPPGVRGLANPKSSTGRLDVFTRMIADHAPGFDQTPPGYNGRLYLEICPQTFPILVRPGSRLSQIRFRGPMDEGAEPAGDQPREAVLSVDLAGGGPSPLIGYRAKRHTGVIDVDRVGAYDVDEFWEPLLVTPQKRLILDPDEFYILASKEIRARAAHLCRGIGAVQRADGRVPRALCGLFRPRFRHDGDRRRRQPRRAGSAQPQGAVHPGGRADHRPADLRAAHRAARAALRPGYRLALSGAGAEAVEAFPRRMTLRAPYGEWR